jgi:hypothetical protein
MARLLLKGKQKEIMNSEVNITHRVGAHCASRSKALGRQTYHADRKFNKTVLV